LIPARTAAFVSLRIGETATPNGSAKKGIASAQRATWLLAPEAEKLEAEVKTFAESLEELSPEIAEEQSMAKEFNRPLKQRDHGAFTSWTERATQSGIPEMKKFALG
jgi:transposase